MEKEGLHRALEYVRQNSLEVGVLVTDRHQQINKWIRESHPQIKHYFDVWHVAKGEYTLSSIETRIEIFFFII